jgi:hypothetical protein
LKSHKNLLAFSTSEEKEGRLKAAREHKASRGVRLFGRGKL